MNTLNKVLKTFSHYTVQRTLTYNTTGDNWNTPSPTAYVTLPASTEWTIQIETKAAAGASAETCYLELAIDVIE